MGVGVRLFGRAICLGAEEGENLQEIAIISQGRRILELLLIEASASLTGIGLYELIFP